MTRFIQKQQEKLGKAPGELTFIGRRILEQFEVEVIDYSPQKMERIAFSSFEELHTLKNPESVTWINIDGLHDTELIASIGNHLDIHPILLEDIANTSQRPKFEEFNDFFFITLKMLSLPRDSDEVSVEHLSILVGSGYLISFQEGLPGDVFNPIRERLQRSTSKVRNRGADYLAFAMVDLVIDNYILIIEQFGEKIELLDEMMNRMPNEELLKKLNDYKREINFLRKVVRPVRELVLAFEKSDSDHIDEVNTIYFKSLVDHTNHSIDAIETYQIMLNDQMNVYQTKQSNKLNDILKVLTLFSVMFIPLTFIAGVYGTNFEYLPEIKFRYGYYYFWGALIAVAVSMYIYFKRKRWL